MRENNILSLTKLSLIVTRTT